LLLLWLESQSASCTLLCEAFFSSFSSGISFDFMLAVQQQQQSKKAKLNQLQVLLS